MNSTANGSETPVFDPKNIAFIVIALLIVVFNGFVIYIVKNRKTPRSIGSSENSILTSLAASDFSSGAIGIPLTFACTYAPPSYCPMCSISYDFIKFVSISTVLHILALIRERSLTVAHPLRQRSKKANIVLITGIWLCSLFISSVPWVWIVGVHGVCSNKGFEETWNPYIVHESVCFLLFFVIPLLFISIFLGRIAIAVHHFTKRSCSMRSFKSVNEQARFRNNEVRIFFLLLGIFLLFVVCWTPYFVLTLLSIHDVHIDVPDWLEFAVQFSRCVTSFLNPFIYAFYREDIYQVIKRKLRRLDFSSSVSREDTSVFRRQKATQVTLELVSN
ncbi:type-1 angiotensin II receptor A-like [Xenia sp. Carnegie-2017]|uniref:type-1 angiotensin II receptor A-like n=1 Tax=Xenia sp. Carnegie-2017 TaxID=2897299 RepID=UPI001F03F22F|nr:type-1 angiotensin II receptor A-like [Xenia sp. Carnegie-2017]